MSGTEAYLSFRFPVPLAYPLALEVAKENRDLAWSIIEPIVLTPDWIDKLLHPTSCGPLIRHARETSVTVQRVNQRGIDIIGKETSETTIRRLLRAYFRYGQVRNALIPDYQARGRRGPTQPHWKKLGRPHEFLRERPDFLGGNVSGSRDDPSTVLGKLFLMFLELRIAKQLSYETAYQQGLSKYFEVNWEEERSGLTGPQQFLPTKHQFVSHCQAFMKSGSVADTEKWLRKLYGDSVYNLKIKPRRSRVERTSAGPGHVVEIDATPFPIPIVRENDRSALIGTVTVYVVADRKTHRKLAVVPVLDHENYDGHAIALYHAATGMRDLLAKHGFERPAIARGMYSTIVSDRGPMFGLSADHLVEAFGVTIETNASYAPNSKPLVEAAHEQFQKSLDGRDASAQRNPAYGARDSQLAACVTMHELEKLLIGEMLHANANQVIKDYEFDLGMTDDGILAIPDELWDWCETHGKMYLNDRPDSYMTLHLIPGDVATVTDKGLWYKGRTFWSEEIRPLVQTELRRRAIRGSKGAAVHVPIAILPWDAGVISTRYPQQQAPVLLFPDNSNDPWRGRSWTEFDTWQTSQKLGKADHESRRRRARAALDARQEVDFSRARAEAKVDKTGKGRRELLADRGQNRADEKAAQASAPPFTFENDNAHQNLETTIAQRNPAETDIFGVDFTGELARNK